FVVEGIRLEGVQLDALGFDVPETGLDVVVAFQPYQVWSHAPVRVFPRRRASYAEIAVAAIAPVGEGDEQATVLVYVPKSELLHRIKTGLVLVLLTGIHAGSARITCAHVDDQSRTESMCPAPAVIPARGTALGRAGLSDRSRNRYTLFGVAEEKIVGVSEAVIYSHLITVRVVDRGPGLDEVVRRVSWNHGIGRRRIRL